MSEHDPYSRVEYRKLIAWPSRIRREWPLLEEVLSSGPSRRVLELGTGPGQHARALAEAGFQVVAVDRSEAQLAAATEEPVPAGLRFVRGDMVEVDRLVEGPFGAALCLGNTLPHLESAGQLTAFAAALARVLEPGAPLLLQILNYDRIHDQRIRTLPVNVRPLEGDAAGDGGREAKDGTDGGKEGGKGGGLHGGGGGTGGAQGAGKDGGKRGGTDGGEHGAAAGRPPGELVFLRVMDPLPDGRVRFYPTTLELRPGADPPMAVKHSREVLLRGWRHAEVAAALAAAGLEPERALGDFDATPFDPATSHDLVLVARRR